MQRANTLTFYVSTTGDNRNPGTETQPFATLEKAREEVRKRLAQGAADKIKVLVRGGVYPLNQTLVFDQRDSAADGSELCYEACPGEEPVFSSGVAVTGWRRLTTPVEGLPEVARGKIWIADVPTLPGGRTVFHTLYEDGRRLPRARSKGFVPQHASELLKDTNTLHFPPGAIKNWPNLRDVEVVIRPRACTVLNILGLAKVDEDSCVATTAVGGTYLLQPVDHFVDNIRESCWVENVLEALDAPGRWVLDSVAGRIYLWPENEKPGEVTVPCLTELIRIDGGEKEKTSVRGLHFKGLSFTQADRATMTDNDATAQHEWELHDRDNALFRFRFAEDCAVENCRFYNSGGAGVRMDLHCQNILVAGNRIEHLGGTGVFLGGYGPGTTNVNRKNTVADNHIHHIGEIYWHSMAIFVWHSSDNLVSGNLIHHTPYSAIVVSGSRPALFGSSKELRLSVAHGPREFKHVRRSELGPAEEWDQVIASDLTNYSDGTEPFIRIINRIHPFQHVDNNVIENNEIHHVIETLGDGNGIYFSDTGKGNIIRGNYIHDLDGVGGQQAIRVDAFTIGSTICDNIIHRCNGGGINIKHYENNVLNNIIADIRTQISVDRHGKPERMYFGYISMVCAMARQLVRADQVIQIKRNILYKKEAGQAFYRIGNTDGKLIDEHMSDSKVHECDLDCNLYYSEANSEDDKRIIQILNEFGLERHGLYADPRFLDVANGDFRLPPDSPAIKIGFHPLK